MTKAITSFLNYRPSDEWILLNSGLPYLKLDIITPFDFIIKEAEKVKHLRVEHRSDDQLADYKNQGWTSLCLYGAGPDITYQTDDKLDWTSVADLCPVTVKWIKENWQINEQTGRIRFMWLAPGGHILPHCDRKSKGLFETNIAITQPKGCQFRFLDYGTVPFKQGSVYALDISNRHMVYNNSNKERLHIIVHSLLKPAILKKSYENCFYN